MIMKKILLSLLLGSLVPSLHAAEASGAAKRPNILLMMCDDMGWLDPSCFGNDRVATPNIDRLAKEGRMMSAFYAASAVCTPTRASVLTGKYPLRFDIRKHFSSARGEHLPVGVTLPKLLQGGGYATVHIGKPQKDPTHTANFGLKLQERCKQLGLKCELMYRGAKHATHKDSTAYLIATLKTPTEQ